MNEFTFNVTGQEADLIINALAQLPFAQVNGLIGKLQDQAKAQIAAANAPVVHAEPEVLPA
jgi:maltose-binding protein MalE